MTIRELISDIQKEVGSDKLQPPRAADLLKEAAALVGNVNDELRKREFEYKTVLLSAYRTEETANRAKLVAETSEQYSAFREAKDTKELVIEMIRSLKYYLREWADEKSVSGNQ